MMDIPVEVNYFRRHCWVALFCVFFLILETKAQDNNVRQTLSVLPSEMYPKMISMIPDGEWGKLNECFKKMEPLLSAIDQEFNTVYAMRLNESIIGRNKDDALSILLEVALYGIISHLDDAINMENRSKVGIITRVSFAEFLSIEKLFKKRHFNRCQAVVMLFRRSYASAGDARKFENTTSELILSLKYLAENNS